MVPIVVLTNSQVPQAILLSLSVVPFPFFPLMLEAFGWFPPFLEMCVPFLKEVVRFLFGIQLCLCLFHFVVSHFPAVVSVLLRCAP